MPAWDNSGGTVTVKTQTVAAVQSALNAARPHSTVYCPAGAYLGGGTITVPDNVCLMGAGIARTSGNTVTNGGTYIAAGLRWGTGIRVEGMTIGSGWNCPRSSGSLGAVFSFVRFRGNGIETGNNYTNDWTSAVKTISFANQYFYDCEVEAGNAASESLNLWFDCRKGGSQMHDDHFVRCHFGVKNPSGVTGTGHCGFQVQPAPSEGGHVNGPFLNGSDCGSVKDYPYYNPEFDWALIDHGAYNISFVDCLWESSTAAFANGHHTNMDICDYARVYSTWHAIQQFKANSSDPYSDNTSAAEGWGNPPGAKWTLIPDQDWTRNVTFLRCVSRGGSTTFEVGKDCSAIDCSGIAVGHSGSYGNSTSGTFPGGHPTSPIFTTDWNAGYTASPYDP